MQNHEETVNLTPPFISVTGRSLGISGLRNKASQFHVLTDNKDLPKFIAELRAEGDEFSATFSKVKSYGEGKENTHPKELFSYGTITSHADGRVFRDFDSDPNFGRGDEQLVYQNEEDLLDEIIIVLWFKRLLRSYLYTFEEMIMISEENPNVSGARATLLGQYASYSEQEYLRMSL